MIDRWAEAGASGSLEPRVDLGDLIDPAPLVDRGRNWTRWAGPAVSILILVAAFYQLRHLPWRQMLADLPSAPGFWLAFGLYYMALPLSEWIIFRRLWHFPPAGLAALLRKLVCNEILLGYVGEVYFYAWARRHAKVSAAPFGAIKDVSILSAITGNVATLAMLLAAAPFIPIVRIGTGSRIFLLAIAVLLASSAAAMILRRRLFTLPSGELRFIAAIHLVRILLMALLAASMWHWLLPHIGLSWWLLLATLRQLVSRLPLTPDKDVLFATLVSLLVGHQVEIVTAMALVAALILAAHLVIGASVGAADLLRSCRE